MPWSRTTLRTRAGSRNALAPTVISASRRTDIPAFYPDWLLARIHTGRALSVHPSGRQAQLLSLMNLRALVLWSKNPEPLLRHLPLLEQAPFGFSVQFTLNDYQAEGLEPGLPPLEERVATFRALSRAIGADRVIWRFDPLLLAGGLEPSELIRRVERLARILAGSTRKLVFSFAEIAGYPRVRRAMEAAGCSWRDFSPREMLQTARALRDVAHRHGLALAACAQPVDLTHAGVPPNACVDPNLLQAVAGPGRSRAAPDGWQVLPGVRRSEPLPRGKDPGQRKHCGCAPSKDIGQYDTCLHGCLYCYATTSQAAAQANAALVTPEAESLLPMEGPGGAAQPGEYDAKQPVHPGG